MKSTKRENFSKFKACLTNKQTKKKTKKKNNTTIINKTLGILVLL